jgi:hypothetical protein
VKRRFPSVLLFTIVLAPLVLAGCFLVSIDPTLAVSVDIDLESYGYNATFDFGPVDPDTGPATVTATIVNVTEGDITVASIAVDEASFQLETPEFPTTYLPGESVVVSLSFDPADSAVVAGVLTVTLADLAVPFGLNLLGEGNYPPTAREAIVVSGAGTALADGTYYRDGTLNVDLDGVPIPYYENPVTGYRIFGEDGDGIDWGIDASSDGTDILYRQYSGVVGPESDGWSTQNGDAPAPVSVGPFTMDDMYIVYPGDLIEGSYVFDDTEGDSEGLSLYQWLRSDTSDYDGTYSPISGATASDYTVVEADGDRYLMLEITPVAETGITTGLPLLIGPTPQVYIPLAQ